jgi:hypothetical protein
VWGKDEKCPDYEEKVCGVEVGGRKKEYYNACTACKDPKMREYYFGQCVVK